MLDGGVAVGIEPEPFSPGVFWRARAPTNVPHRQIWRLGTKVLQIAKKLSKIKGEKFNFRQYAQLKKQGRKTKSKDKKQRREGEPEKRRYNFGKFVRFSCTKCSENREMLHFSNDVWVGWVEK